MKTAIITGASEGIGRAFAQKLAERGYAVTAVARNEARLKELMGALAGSGHSFFTADLAQKADVTRISGLIEQRKFDLLINNAGIGIYGDFSKAGLSELLGMTKLNCDTLLEFSHSFLKGAQSGNALINVSSTASFLPMPISSAYAASKAFVTSLSESLWFEERRKGVYVLGLCPGMTTTRFHTRAGGEDEQIPKWFSQSPEQVVAIALRALKHRKRPIVACGPQRPLIFLSRFIPRKWVILLAGHLLEQGLKKRSH